MAKNEVAEDIQAPPCKPLVRSMVTFADARFVQWSAIVPRGTTKERLTQSALWSVVSDNFHTGDLITCMEESRAFWAQVLVIDAGRGYATTQLIQYHPLPALLVTQEGLPPGFEIFYAGPDNEAQYCAKRVCDGVLMVKGQPSRDAALAKLLESATLR